MEAALEPRTRLGKILRDEGRKQSWLAERTGIARGDVSRIVNGLHTSETNQRAIAEALERSVEEVFPA